MARIAAAAALVLALLIAAGPAAAKKKKKPKQPPRPNIVLVMTDDQAAETQRFLSKTNDLLGSQGVTFANSFVTYSLCCPSRETMLTGQYAHNHDVRGNTLPSGGYTKAATQLSNSLPVWLQQAGYRTAHVGKFLNGYGNTSPDTEIPPGWSEWYGALDNPDAYAGGTYTMYGYTLNENGAIVHYGSTPTVIDAFTYQTDVYSAKAADFIRRNAPGKQPFYLSVAPLASHTEVGQFAPPNNNPRAALRHEGTLAGVGPPFGPNFNESDVSDKPAAIQSLTPMTVAQQVAVANTYRAQAESLLSVDDMVENIVNTLAEQGELKNTVLIYTADNGFFHGEHRVRNGKIRLYEESIRVPLLIRGPGVPKGATRAEPAANVDLAPTIVDFADARAGRTLDGVSLLPAIEDKLKRLGRAVGIEAFFNSDLDEDPEAPPLNFRAVRTDRYLYAEYGTGDQELYDLETDPFELTSRHNDPSLAPVESSLARLLGSVANCAGRGCAAKPAVKLRLKPRGGCASLDATVAGSLRREALEATFRSGGKKVGGDASPPLKRTVSGRRLRGNDMTATVTMLDGRVASLERRLPKSC